MISKLFEIVFINDQIAVCTGFHFCEFIKGSTIISRKIMLCNDWTNLEVMLIHKDEIYTFSNYLRISQTLEISRHCSHTTRINIIEGISLTDSPELDVIFISPFDMMLTLLVG